MLQVGAGASGVGVALMLTRIFGLEQKRVLLVERGEGVGETFRRWPKEMRFISPSSQRALELAVTIRVMSRNARL